jgi:hypothetical protein
VFREVPNVLTINLIGNPSVRCRPEADATTDIEAGQLEVQGSCVGG